MPLLKEPLKVGIVAIFFAAPIGASAAHLAATDWHSNVRNTWEFKVDKGAVRIDLLVAPTEPHTPSLDLIYEGDAHPSLAEEAGFLREALHQLPALGIDPHNLSFIMLRGFAEPEVERRLALAALRSKDWQSFTTVSGGAERVVEDLLNSLGAYDELNLAFKEYGLCVRPGGVEKVSSARCLDLRIPDLPCSAHHNPRLPTGANLYLILEKAR